MLQFMPSISTTTAITGLKWEMFVSVGSKLQQSFYSFFVQLQWELVKSIIPLIHPLICRLFVRLLARCSASVDRALRLGQG